MDVGAIIRIYIITFVFTLDEVVIGVDYTPRKRKGYTRKTLGVFFFFFYIHCAVEFSILIGQKVFLLHSRSYNTACCTRLLYGGHYK